MNMNKILAQLHQFNNVCITNKSILGGGGVCVCGGGGGGGGGRYHSKVCKSVYAAKSPLVRNGRMTISLKHT